MLQPRRLNLSSRRYLMFNWPLVQVPPAAVRGEDGPAETQIKCWEHAMAATRRLSLRVRLIRLVSGVQPVRIGSRVAALKWDAPLQERVMA